MPDQFALESTKHHDDAFSLPGDVADSADWNEQRHHLSLVEAALAHSSLEERHYADALARHKSLAVSEGRRTHR